MKNQRTRNTDIKLWCNNCDYERSYIKAPKKCPKCKNEIRRIQILYG